METISGQVGGSIPENREHPVGRIKGHKGPPRGRHTRLRPKTPLSIIGRGLRLVVDGVEFLDAESGTFNVPLGYDHPRVVESVVAQLRRCAHVSSSFSKPCELAVLQMLVDLAPESINSGWMRDVVGSTGNECAIKIAQKSTGKRGVISFYRSHHGQSIYTTAISGPAFRGQHFPAIANVPSIKVPPPYCYRCPYKKASASCGFLCAEAINDAILNASAGSVAAIIAEPVLGNGGNIVPPPGYFEALTKICREHEVLLIADEVQTGIGRTGTMFAAESLGMTPNIITLAKGLSGIGVPAAAVLMEERLNVLEPYEHSFTSGGGMLALAAARATLEVIREDGFLEGVRSRGKFLMQQLQQLPELHACVGDVRGLGMMWGLEIVRPNKEPHPEKMNRILRCAKERHRLILRGSAYGFGNVVKVRPALVATEDDIVEIVTRLSRAIHDVEAGG